MSQSALSDPDHAIESVKQAWQVLLERDPKIRIRDAAAVLGLSEAQLIACGCGDTVTRLSRHWVGLIEALPSLGYVMALTRNDHAVHEKMGRYCNIRITGNMGLVLDSAIDLRLFLNHWHFGFAVREEGPNKVRQSLQFFDSDGTAVHKIYLTEYSVQRAFDMLVRNFQAADQSPRQMVLTKPPEPPVRPDEEIDSLGLQAHWQALRDTHDFHALLKAFGVSRVQGLRLGSPNFAKPVEPSEVPVFFETVAEQMMEIMVFVGSQGVVQIHTGLVNNLKVFGPWFNVLDEDFNLHLRQEAVASAWVVTKPTVDGPVTSLELYDSAGKNILLVYGKRKPGQTEDAVWRDLVNALPLQETSS